MYPIYDAVIIGAGPAGSFCSYLLAKHGLRVLLLEANAKIKRKVCGEYLSPMGVSILREEGLNKMLIEPFLPINGMKIVPAKGKALSTKFPEKNGIAVNRKIFDENFLNLARDVGVCVRLGSKVSEIKKESIGYCIKEIDGQLFCARLLIGADGRNSVAAKMLGLKNKIDTRRIALHCHIPTIKKNERFGEMHLFEDGSYIGVDPTGDNEINLSLCCDKGKVKSTKLHELLNSFINSSPELLENYGTIDESVKINTVTPITNKMAKFVERNAALIGDAAGFLDPLTGEGMTNALWMARTLANEIKYSKSVSLFDYQSAIDNYAVKKKKFFRQKLILNKIFQFIIKKPSLVNILASYLRKKQSRANVFVGIIGNIYRPIEGIFKLIKS